MGLGLEQRIKTLKIQLHELSIAIHGTLHEIDRFEQELAPLEKKLEILLKNKNFLKEYSLIVSLPVYSDLKLELKNTQIKFNKIYNLLDKYKAYLDSLLIRENAILDEINLLNKEIDKQKKVLKFDLNRKKNGQK